MSGPDRETMPYRDCVGTAVFNGEGKVFIGRRRSAGDPEESAAHGAPWQMPQPASCSRKPRSAPSS